MYFPHRDWGKGLWLKRVDHGELAWGRGFDSGVAVRAYTLVSGGLDSLFNEAFLFLKVFFLSLYSLCLFLFYSFFPTFPPPFFKSIFFSTLGILAILKMRKWEKKFKKKLLLLFFIIIKKKSIIKNLLKTWNDIISINGIHT